MKLHHFQLFNNIPSINHFISTRKGGISKGDIGELNLSFKVHDSEENVRYNRKQIAESMGVSAEKLVIPSQTHSNNVAEVDNTNYSNTFADTDALVTNTPGICIAVLSADCVPILLYDAHSNSAAAIHAGWRGTVAGIVTRAVDKMQELYKADPSAMIAGIGPSICAQVYEVGQEVADEFVKIFGNDDSIVKPKSGGKYLVDLWEANGQLLIRAGLKNENIEISGICTYTNSDEFFSARRSGNKAGRFGAGILLK